MHEELMSLIFDVMLKARILRVWQQASAARPSEFSEREMLTLELAKEYAPITEKQLTKIFGIAASSVNDIIGKLVSEGLVKKDPATDGRTKVLTVTPEGEQRLCDIKHRSAARYMDLIAGLPVGDVEVLKRSLQAVNALAKKRLLTHVFNSYGV